jgi:hypothetical protein
MTERFDAVGDASKPTEPRTFAQILGTDPEAPPPAVFGYRDPWRWFPFFVISASAILVVVGLFVDGADSADRAAGAAAVIAAFAYGLLFKVGSGVEYADGVVTWRAPLATREVPVAKVVGCSGFIYPKLRLQDGSRLMMTANSEGWDYFVESLGRVCPRGSFARRKWRVRSWPLGDGYYEH